MKKVRAPVIGAYMCFRFGGNSHFHYFFNNYTLEASIKLSIWLPPEKLVEYMHIFNRTIYLYCNIFCVLKI